MIVPTASPYPEPPPPLEVPQENPTRTPLTPEQVTATCLEHQRRLSSLERLEINETVSEEWEKSRTKWMADGGITLISTAIAGSVQEAARRRAPLPFRAAPLLGAIPFTVGVLAHKFISPNLRTWWVKTYDAENHARKISNISRERFPNL